MSANAPESPQAAAVASASKAAPLVHSPPEWREGILNQLLFWTMTLGMLVYPPSLYMSIVTRLFDVAIMDTVVLVIVVCLNFRRNWPYRIRATTLCALMYFLSVCLLYSVGSISQIYLFGFSLITLLLLGMRAGLLTIPFNAVTMLAFGVIHTPPLEMSISTWGNGLTAWIVITFNFLFINALLTISLGQVIRHLEAALLEAGNARKALEEEDARLRAANDAFEKEVNERRRAEQALREVAASLNESQRIANLGNWVWDLREDVMHWSEGVYRILGMPLQPFSTPVQREAFLSRIPFTERQTVEIAICNALSEKSSYDIEHRIVGENASERIVRQWGVVNAVEAERPASIFGNVQDITERRTAEERLRQSESLLRIAGSVARLGGWSFDLTEDFLRWSDEACSIHEVPPGTQPNLVQALNFCAPEWRERISQAFATCFRDGIPIDMELEIITTTGRRKWVRSIGNPETDANGMVYRVQGAIQDITAGKRAEEERDKLEADLRQSQKMEGVGRLAGGVAHDFNNMLCVILGHATMALETLPPEDPVRENLQEIISAGQHSAELTTQLLAFARKQAIAPRILDLNDCISSMLRLLRPLIRENIDLHWKPGPSPLLVKVDPAQVNQLLANLTVNARDSIAESGNITIETRRETVAHIAGESDASMAAGNYVVLSITDDGCGIDRETQLHIFEPFFTTKGPGQGTGLGLATVYGIVKQNNGHIEVFSEPGAGSTITILLPQATQDILSSETPQSKVVQTGSETVLLVEDETALRELGATMLARLGYHVLSAATPEEAIAMVEGMTDEIALLLTDVIMPGMSGRDLWEELSARRPRMKCLFMSGYTDDIIAHHGIIEKGMHFLQKPFSRKELAARVREALDS